MSGKLTAMLAAGGTVFGPIGTAIGGVLGAAGDAMSSWWTMRQETKKAAHDNQIALATAKTQAMIRAFERGQAYDFAWEKTSIDNSGWKDEFVTVAYSIPALLAMFPDTRSWAAEWFTAMGAAPEWYLLSLGGIIASSLGIRGLSGIVDKAKGAPLGGKLGTAVTVAGVCADTFGSIKDRVFGQKEESASADVPSVCPMCKEEWTVSDSGEKFCSICGLQAKDLNK